MWTWIWMTIAAAMPMSDMNWVVVNDSVMGGVSQSSVQVADSLVFEGELSLERNGGFASIRARTPEGAFEGAQAVRLRLIGDGRTYDLTLRRSDIPLRAGSYRVRVDTEIGPTEVTVPLSAFRPTSFGRPVPGAPALDASLELIDTVGVMLADKQPGAFKVEVLAMTVIQSDEAPVTSRQPAIDTLVAAIETGVAQYNDGSARACRKTYTIALESALESGLLTPGESSLIEEALGTLANQSDEQAAWTARYAMDSVLYTGGSVRPKSLTKY